MRSFVNTTIKLFTVVIYNFTGTYL